MVQYFNKDFFRPGNIEALLNRKFMQPNETLESVAEIDTGKHFFYGIKAYIFDIDYTLPRNKKEYMYYKAVVDKLEEIKSKFKVCALSNLAGSVDDEDNSRAKSLRELLGIEIISSPVKKPNPIAFQYALEDLGTKAKETCVVGDRPFTDILGGNRIGAYTILVKPLAKESQAWYVSLARWIESTVHRLYCENKVIYSGKPVHREVT